MSDTIFLKNIELFITIGAHNHERVRRQKILISIEMQVDTSGLISSDDPSSLGGPTGGVDYEKVHQMIGSLGETKKYHLLETFAEHIAEKIFFETSALEVNIRLSKQNILSHTEEVGVAIHRKRKGV